MVNTEAVLVLYVFMPVPSIPKSQTVFAMYKRWTLEIKDCSHEQRIEKKE